MRQVPWLLADQKRALYLRAVTQQKARKTPKKPVNPALGKRMNEAMALANDGEGVSQNKLVEMVRRLMGAEHDPGFKLSQAGVQKICAGRVERSDYIPHIAKALNVDAFWLATGRGEMRECAPSLAPRHLALIQSYLALPKELRLPIRQLIEVSRTLMNPAKLAEQDKRFIEASAKLRAEPAPQEASSRK